MALNTLKKQKEKAEWNMQKMVSNFEQFQADKLTCLSGKHIDPRALVTNQA